MGHAILIIVCLAASMIPISVSAESEPKTEGDIRIVATFFPIYLFTKNITAGIENIKVEILLPSTYGCPHDYSVSPDDIRKIHEADIIVMNGLGMEEFLSKILPTEKYNPRIIVASEGLKPIKLRYYEGGGSSSGSQHENNPHIFASPKEAAEMARTITDSLIQILPQYEDNLKKNGRSYEEALDNLSKEFSDSLQNLKNPKIVTVHEVFDYMARDYGFIILDVIEKEPGQEPSAKELISEVNEFRQEGVAALFSEPQYSTRIVDMIGKEVGIPVYSLDPVASGPIDPPLDYYQAMMSQNLTVLMKAMK